MSKLQISGAILKWVSIKFDFFFNNIIPNEKFCDGITLISVNYAEDYMLYHGTHIIMCQIVPVSSLWWFMCMKVKANVENIMKITDDSLELLSVIFLI